MGFYFIFAVSFIPALYVLLVWIPPQFGAIYVVAVILGLFYPELKFVEMATYSRGFYGRTFIRFWWLTYGPIFTAFVAQLIQQTNELWNRHSGKLPPKLRGRLISLKRSIQRVRQNRRLRGRVDLFLAFLGLLTLLLVIGYILYGTYCGFPFHF
jgi:hypothetical protein